MVKKAFCALFVLFLCQSLQAQQTEVRSRDIIESPTAGLLPMGSFDLDLRIFAKGGILSGIDIGLTDRFLIGLSYGGVGIIGNTPADSIKWNPKVGIEAKYLILDGSGISPVALALGFNSQGFGEYNEKYERYTRKSKGVYLAFSKNYSFLGRLGLHWGINYSLEKGDKDDNLSGYLGFDKEINPELSLIAEYDFATNDNENLDVFGSNKGYLNAGLRWTFARKLNLEVDFKNIIPNGIRNSTREIRAIYLEYL